MAGYVNDENGRDFKPDSYILVFQELGQAEKQYNTTQK